MEETARHNRLSKAELIRKLLYIGYEEFAKDSRRGHPKTDEIVRDLYNNRALSREVQLLNEMVKDSESSRKEFSRRIQELQEKITKLELKLGMEE